MPGLDIQVQLEGDVQLRRKLGVSVDHIKDLRPAWKDVQDELEDFQRNVFRRSGAYQGLSKWQKLSPGYAETKPRPLRDKPLILTGRLRRSFLTENSPDATRTMTKTLLEYGTKVPYAGKHQKGKGVPERKPLRLTKRMRREIVKIIQEFIVKSKQFQRFNIQ